MSSFAKNTTVTFIVPDQSGPAFWQIVTDLTRKVGKDLSIDLEIIYSDSNRFASLKVIQNIISRQQKPDYLIFRPFYGNAVEIFSLLESNKIPFVTLEQAFIGKEAEQLGVPKINFKY